MNAINTEKTSYFKMWMFAVIIISLYPSLAKSQTIENFINKVQAYQDGVKLITKGDSTFIDDKTFNLKAYMQMFDKIKLEQGYEYDYYAEGRPYIYVKKSSFNLDSYFEQLADDNGIYNKVKRSNAIRRSKLEFVAKSENRAFNHVIPENSEEGYIQYLFFYEFGEQFGIIGHEAYNEKSVVPNLESKYVIYDKNLESPNSQSNKNKEIDQLNIMVPKIWVDLSQKNCKISWYENELCRGTFLKTYTIGCTAPYVISKISDKCIMSSSFTGVW